MSSLTDAERKTMVENAIKQFEAQKFEAEMLLVANRRVKNAESVASELREKIASLDLGIEDLNREYRGLLAASSEAGG